MIQMWGLLANGWKQANVEFYVMNRRWRRVRDDIVNDQREWY